MVDGGLDIDPQERQPIAGEVGVDQVDQRLFLAARGVRLAPPAVTRALMVDEASIDVDEFA